MSPQATALLADRQQAAVAGVQRTRLVQRLQSAAGNAYVSRMIQRVAVHDAPAEAPPRKVDPHEDPKFVAVEHKVGQSARHEKQHAPARSKVREAQGAAVGPPNDVASQAEATQVDKMAQQKPGEFDKKAFIDAVNKAIAAAAPKNLEEADDFKESDKPAQVKNEVGGLVGKGKQDSEGAIKQANTEAPDSSQAKPKPVTPMGPENAGAEPAVAGAAQAVPSPKTAAETSMAAGPAEVNQHMARAEVTEEQLKKSNEPQFNDALDAKKTAEKDSQKAPAEYRVTEAQTLSKSATDAKNVAGAGVHAMHGERAAALDAITGHKVGAKSQDEAKRAEVASKIETIFNQTRTDVTAILDGLDGKVNTAFDAGERDARTQFETYVDQKMTAYKDERYDGIIGKGRWVKDKLLGMPDEVNAFYAQGRAQYLKQMEGVISRVADIVGAELGKAKKRIADGRQQVKDYVASQPKALQKVAQDAEQQMSSKFDQLDSDVAAKQDAMVQSLADKYVAARDALDDRINQLKAENKGLVNKAVDAIAGVIQTIKQLKDMLLNVLQKAANVIGDIIKDPIKFLGNLVGAIKQGLNQFVSNIATHLKKGLMGWLFGTLGGAGLQLPDSFDLKGILSLILQILGLTYDNVRAIAVKIVGEKVVSAVEGTVKFFITLAKEGPAGLWQWLKDKIDQINIKDMVIGAIKDFVITRIIVAGVSWLIGLLNPAAAFIKACKMIYDVIMFFIERGSQIMEFVNSILDGLGAIVSGSIGAAANLVESSLAKILPLAISFLASLLGIGGIADKIKEIIEKIRGPINKLITAVVGPLLRPLKKLYDKGAKFVTGIVDKGKALGKKALDKVKGKFYGGSDEDKQKRLQEGVSAGKSAVDRLDGRRIGQALIRPVLSAVRLRYRLPVLEPVREGGFWAVHGEVSRMTMKTDKEADDGSDDGGQQPGQVITGFHGANGDAILGILASGTLKPSDAKIFLAKYDFAQSFMHGGDTKRKAAFVLELECTLPAKGGVSQEHKATPGVASTVELGTAAELPVKVLAMHVRRPKPADEGGGFEFSKIVGPDKIREFLSGAPEDTTRTNYRPPSNRHYPHQVSIAKSAGNSMLLVDKATVMVDVEEINSGKARKEGAVFVTASGRRYGLTGDELHPIDGPGIQELNSQQYNLLKLFKDNPQKAMQSMKILTDKGILSASDADMVHKLAQQFLGVA